MSFRIFIYYCALCGGWAAFLAWGLVQVGGLHRIEQLWLRTGLIGALLGMFVAAAVGLLDALLNSVGSQRLLRGALCLILGAFGGAIGGLIGEVLNGLGMPILLGWVLAGVLIGASIGAFDVLQAMQAGGLGSSIKKMLNGIYGGFLGGLIGGVPFTFLAGSQDWPRSSLAVSLVLLGSSIGLMIGLAQVVLKEAWLKVEEGFRAGRELMLTKEKILIGRAEGCDLGLFGDPSIQREHARIVQKNNRYILEHIAEEGETLLNDEPVSRKGDSLRDGDVIGVGKSRLRFGERAKRKN